MTGIHPSEQMIRHARESDERRQFGIHYRIPFVARTPVSRMPPSMPSSQRWH
ncbi:hypothetical protein [Sinorhizobium psoraleae]|uniref:Uncharacterized protein n=1 Tax=Sinorhizobium psoraleae TaxID=520838 RepID=A0ABT4KNR8_9HYPH|nr:hypothetical protein [Sinorhizobium psoraleae]MCZ4093610.1 hypothetical protein [Sinorhizobium psoraleae]